MLISEDKKERIYFKDGTIYYKNKKEQLHRENGPAVLNSDGSEKWFLNGKMHRFGGPAYTNHDGTRIEWWIDDKKYTEISAMRIFKIKSLKG